MGFQHVHFDAGRIAFARPGMAITLNGIAQGFAPERARQGSERDSGIVEITRPGRGAAER